MIAGLMVLALSVPAFAHCGKCGMDGDHAAEAAAAAPAEATATAHAGADCPMHAEKNKVLLDAAKALEGTNADLAAKLKDLAAKCCS